MVDVSSPKLVVYLKSLWENERGMIRKRKGMIIKNADKVAKSVELSTRALHLPPGGTATLTSDEVMDPTLRDLLQVRALAIVRPITQAEEVAIRKELAALQETEHP